MKTLIAKTAAKYSSLCSKMHVGTHMFVSKNASSLMLVVGLALVAGGTVNGAFAQPTPNQIDTGPIVAMIQILLGDLIEGAFGALLMVVAGLVAIISAAMGAYRAAMAALVIAVGAFILRSFVSAFFGASVPEISTT